ncbi:PadR family transcriptional regulator [uncultured Clostridium sp.]|jgi:DNA-binding PadR family transcriptional regulator|uniref:PadR family transcriptional regulator n=1 Tax=uncultured Clostridium sp. TaxID=59620 RepID=UPI00261B3E37|nr:PadR family transcriptional regulator [uncultured Clostridium sp.]
MKNQIIRKIFNGFIYIHILHHGTEGEFYGSWMMEELKEHGYKVSPGTLYPVLKSMVDVDLIEKHERVVDGKVRKYYRTTESGKELLIELKGNLAELIHEVEK